MTENKRFKWEDVYKWEVPAFLEVMNGLHEKNEQLQRKNEQLKKEKERYKRLSEIRDENINNRILSLKEFINNCEDEKVRNTLEDLFYSEVKEYDLAKENRKLKKENEQLKQENQGIQNKVWRLLNWFCDVEKVITKEQVKEWWNSEMIDDD